MSSIVDIFRAGSQAQGDRVAIVVGNARTTWRTLAAAMGQATELLGDLSRARVGLLHRGDAASWAALGALDQLQSDAFLLDAELPEREIQQLAHDFRLAVVIDPAEFADGGGRRSFSSTAEAAGADTSSVTILTSGTTGRPKAVKHSWTSLCRPIRAVAADAGAAWLLTYRPQLYAGLQVSLQCFTSGGTLVQPPPRAAAEEIVELMIRERVACVSATPSYWRNLLYFAPAPLLARLDLRQITLGGEIVDQTILDRLAEQFPSARIAHIYATTELGRCFSVTDVRAGFPARFLDRVSPDGVELRIEDDQLFVRSANAMRQYDDQDESKLTPERWFATGDLVRVAGDRCYFVGRESDIINVGGNKVSPQEVEAVLRSVPGVADVRVYAKASSMVGQLVAAEVVPLCAQNSETVKALVFEHARTHLSIYQRPRIVDMVQRIELTEAGKTRRR